MMTESYHEMLVESGRSKVDDRKWTVESIRSNMDGFDRTSFKVSAHSVLYKHIKYMVHTCLPIFSYYADFEICLKPF